MAVDLEEEVFRGLQNKVQVAVSSDWNLRTFKGIFLEILRIVRDPTAGAKDLAHVVSKDPGLTARTLRVVNSTYYNLPTKVNDLTQAIILLGFEMLKQISLSISVFEIFHLEAKSHLLQLWRDGLDIAKVSEMLAKQKQRLSGEAYTAGLLCHIGKFFLCSAQPSKYIETLKYSRTHAVSDIEAERFILGIDHRDIGYVLAKYWELPPLIRDAIRSHHEQYIGSPLSDMQYVSQVVLLANEICRHLELGIGTNSSIMPGEELIQRIPLAYYEILNLTKDDLLQVWAQLPPVVKEIDDLLILIEGEESG